MIEGEFEALSDFRLNFMHFGAIFGNRLARLGSGKLCWCAMLVRGADEHHLIATLTHIAREQIGGKLRAHQIAQVLDPVDIGNGRGDQYPCHAKAFRLMRENPFAQGLLPMMVKSQRLDLG